MAMADKDQPQMEDEESMDKKLAEDLAVAGNALLSSPSSAELLLPVLDKLGNLLEAVVQSPSDPVKRAMNTAMKALTSNELLNHVDADVKVSVALSICEIMRITAPHSPFGDEQLKEILKLIVGAFDNISDISSRSYPKKVSLLRTFARIKLWVLLLDLQCGSLIWEMFDHFLRNIRESHPDVVFMFMGFIMIMVLEEYESIPSGLLASLLGSVRNGNQDVLPIARKLGERVIESCASKLELYMHEAVRYTGLPVDNYAKIVAYICKQKSESVKQNKAKNTHKHAKTIPSAESNIASPVNETSALDEIPMEKEKLTNVPSLDTFCDIHQNKTLKLKADPLTEEIMIGGTSTREFNVKIPKSCSHSFMLETKTSTDVGNMVSKTAVESIVGGDKSCCESEDKNERLSIFPMEVPLKGLFPGKLKKLRSPQKENHHINPGHEAETSSQVRAHRDL